jgi:hypothetical protein
MRVVIAHADADLRRQIRQLLASRHAEVLVAEAATLLQTRRLLDNAHWDFLVIAGQLAAEDEPPIEPSGVHVPLMVLERAGETADDVRAAQTLRPDSGPEDVVAAIEAALARRAND